MVTPYTRKFGVTFPVAVDTADVFGRAFGLKAIPVSFLVDEVGIIRLRGGGPDPGFLRQVDAILKEPTTAVRSQPPALPASRSLEELESAVEATPGDWRKRLALAEAYDSARRWPDAEGQLQKAADVAPQEASIFFTWGLVLFHQDRKEDALAKMKQARDLDPNNWRIHKQIWAIEHPEKFYRSDSPDFGWQKAELAREKAAQK